ncbi:hypothetical protein HW560_11790 [Paenibacillus sp. E222]|uniref:hypothetical protein n=1 Tax=Paenibacillus sp. E222 TaxID=2748863 RepID=UPI0015C5ECD9|nr:hypothetical protein [Paenibacillus sp. E222]QLG38721.1 hypothetical protein HW560_11790 [Paenibacillus sp. E222]
MASKKGGKRMAVSLRERPTLQGKDAERFISKMKRNEESMKKHAARKVKEYYERLSKGE